LKLGFDAGDRVDDQLGKSVASLKLWIGSAPSVIFFVWQSNQSFPSFRVPDLTSSPRNLGAIN